MLMWSFVKYLAVLLMGRIYQLGRTFENISAILNLDKRLYKYK